MNRWMVCSAVWLWLLPFVCPAQADWEMARKWSPDKVNDKMGSVRGTPHWDVTGKWLWYAHTGAQGTRFWLVNIGKKAKTPLFDQMKLARYLSRISGENIDHLHLDLAKLTLSPDGTFISFDFKKQRYQYDRSNNKLTRLPVTLEKHDLSYLNLSPSGQVGVFQMGNNLFLQSMSTPTVAVCQISTDGEKGYSWGSLGELIDNADPGKKKVDALWSPDSGRLCLLRMDVRAVPDMWLVDHLAQPQPILKTYKATHPGGRVPQWELWILEVQNKQLKRIETARWADQTLEDLSIVCQWWSQDSNTLFFTRRHRDYTMVDLCTAEPASGRVDVLVEERLLGEVFIKPPVLQNHGRSVLWWSQRSGYGHYYRVDRSDQTIVPITEGSFNIDEFIAMNEENGYLFVMANGRERGRNPYYTHLYQVDPITRDLTLLTPEDATHSISMSPDKRFFVDNFSRVDLPTRTVLRKASGQLLMELETADVSILKAEGWEAPQPFQAKSADSVTDLWGVMYKPFNFDAGKKYPVITRVYPGRMSEFIPHDFYPVNMESTLAQLGFIVVQFGNRGGCFNRGTVYGDYGRRQFRDYGLADKKAVIEELARRFAFIDGEKVGIYGGSSGGFMTVSAMLAYPEFFKVGVAATGPHDPSIYYSHWLERYRGVTLVNQNNGEPQWKTESEGNIEIAKNLRGKLLLVAGEQDDNVHPAHLFRLADAFIKAGKTVDMMIIPGANHGLGDWRYYYSQLADYFARHLMNCQRPGADILFEKK